MNNLPTREQTNGILILRNVQVANNSNGIAVVEAYVDDVLMTRQEFIDSLDLDYHACTHQHVINMQEIYRAGEFEGMDFDVCEVTFAEALNEVLTR